MTHNELLAKLWEKRNSLCDNLDVHFALSKVVELHKPDEYSQNKYCSGCEQQYPCPTIRLTKEELK